MKQVVLAIGSFVRSMFTLAAYRIPLDEMPYPDLLIQLCESIYVARRHTYAGHLLDEMRLFQLLKQLYRSPEILLKMTRHKL